MARYNVKTHGSIIEVASRLFMQQGFNQTTTRQISDGVGITQPNLYYYYKDKETLYHAVVTSELTRIGERLLEIAEESHQDFQTSLLKMANYIIFESNTNIFILLHDMETSVSPDVRKDVNELWQYFHRYSFVKLFQSFDCELRTNVSSDDAARYFFCLILSCFPRTEESRDKVEKLVDLFLNGVIQPQTQKSLADTKLPS